jgi:hypothetical protein
MHCRWPASIFVILESGSRRWPEAWLRHEDFADESVPFDRQDDAGGFHWPLAGAGDARDREDDGPGSSMTGSPSARYV